MTQSDPFHDGIIASLPHLRAFAHLLTRNHTRAEDLVQDTVVRAISHRDQFQPGTNLRGWLITILRNWYFNDVRKGALRSTQSLDTIDVERSESGNQEGRMQLRDVKRHFDKLPAEQREALILVGVNGFSYEEAGEIVGCPAGTVKSRVSRARMQLQIALGERPAAPSPTVRAVATPPRRPIERYAASHQSAAYF